MRDPMTHGTYIVPHNGFARRNVFPTARKSLRGAVMPRYNNLMNPLAFFRDYMVWHYSRALYDLAGISRDLLWFVYHFFSIPLLTRTFFTPLSRIRAGGISILDIEGSLQNIALNLIARAVGILLRAVVIAAGIAAEIALAVLLTAIFACWLVLPFVVVFLFLFSIGIFV